MSVGNKAKNAKESTKGAVKEAAGRVKGDRSLKSKGQGAAEQGSCEASWGKGKRRTQVITIESYAGVVVRYTALGTESPGSLAVDVPDRTR